MIGRDTFGLHSCVFAHLSLLGFLELCFSLPKELSNFSVGHLHALINDDVTEGEKDQHHVVLSHLDLLLLHTIQI